MKKLIILLSFIAGATMVQAQENYFYFNLDINTPLSNTDWISSTTAHGGKLGYRAYISERFSAGVDLGWTTYNQYFPKTTFAQDNGSITTDYYNYITSYSAVASGQYKFKLESKRIFPYAGLGLGAMQNTYKMYYNIYEDQEKSWGFLARPEAGVLVKIFDRRSVGLMAAVHYDYSTNKSASYGYSSFNSFGVQFGIIIAEW